jgi:hypothetical protein
MSALTLDLTAPLSDTTRRTVGTVIASVGGLGLGLSLAAALTDPAAAVVLATGPIAAIVTLVGLRIAGPKDGKSFRLHRR